MTKRPLNECLNCGNTWYPKGRDLSDECRRCKSRSVRIVPEMSAPPMQAADASSAVVLLVGGGIFILLVGAIAGAFILNNPRADPDKPVVKANEPTKNGRDEELPRQRINEKSKPRLDPITKPSDPTSTPKKELPDPLPVAPDVPLAPAPRLLPLNRPPAGLVTEWERLGEIQTRVTGAVVIRPILADDTGHEFPSPDPALVVWVETRSLPAGRASLRRWFNPLNDNVVLTTPAGTRVQTAKRPVGAWLGGQLKGEHSLVPGGAGVVDVLAFEVPAASTQHLLLKLAGGHVGEQGTFLHKIPRETWSKK